MKIEVNKKVLAEFIVRNSSRRELEELCVQQILEVWEREPEILEADIEEVYGIRVRSENNINIDLWEKEMD